MRWLFFLCLFFPLFAEEEIVVHLVSQDSLTPIYLSVSQDSQSGFDKNYLHTLEKILRFDFEHNGKTDVVSSKNNVHTIDLKINKKELDCKLQIPSTGGVKRMEGIKLTGDLAHDRRVMHRVHDVIFETLFETEGAANTRILYTIRTKKNDDATKWATEIWEADYDGANGRQITNDGYLCVTPTYIPETHNFLYVSYKVGQPKIYAASIEEGIGKRLTYLRGNQLMPTLSPTLDKIAFISDVTGNPDLFIQDFSLKEGLLGKPYQIFCAPGATQGTPTFSPDGKKIAFVSNKDGTPRIYILKIPPPGSSIKSLKPQIISKKNRNNTCPAWSPDGTKIAYSSHTSGTRQIWIYDLLTGEETQLTDGYGHKENPTWAPNGLQLIFNSSTNTSSELFLINLNQKKAVKITQGPGEKRFPSWESCNNKRKI